MNENKYYTPEMNEFHIGFEYDIFEDFDIYSEKTWHKQIYGVHGNNPEHLDYVSSFLIKENWVRVKYLDKEDIESLGFKFFVDEDLMYRCNWFVKDSYKSERSDVTDCEILFNPITHWVLIAEYYDDNDHDKKTRFAGYIKNISELRKLLKQLNIE